MLLDANLPFGLAPFHRTRSKFDFYYVYMHRSMNKIVEITGRGHDSASKNLESRFACAPKGLISCLYIFDLHEFFMAEVKLKLPSYNKTEKGKKKDEPLRFTVH